MFKVKGSGSSQTVTQYNGPFGFQSIAYAGSNDFIVKHGGTDELIRYCHIGTASGGTYYERTDLPNFYVYNHRASSGYTIRQDIAYHTLADGRKMLYVILGKQIIVGYDENNKPIKTIRENIILTYNLSGPSRTYTDGLQIFDAVDMFVTKKNGEDNMMYKYEVDSIDFDPENKILFYLYANASVEITVNGVKKEEAHDAVYKVTLKSN